MIIKILFEVIESLLRILLLPLPNLPKLPIEISNIFNLILNYLKSSVAFVNAIYPLSLGIKLATFALLVKNFKRIYRGVMFILKKIPFLGIK